MSTPGTPPPLRGNSSTHLCRSAIACRAFAIVLDLQGHPCHATHLRVLAAAATRQAEQSSTPAQPGLRAAA